MYFFMYNNDITYQIWAGSCNLYNRVAAVAITMSVKTVHHIFGLTLLSI